VLKRKPAVAGDVVLFSSTLREWLNH